MKRIVLSVTLAVCSASPQASDRDGAYGSLRADNCRELVRVHPTGERRPESVGVRNWVAGYLTAYNRQTPETYDISGIYDFEQVLLSVEKFCKANPLADLGAAMEAVTEELRPTRHQTRRQAGH